MREDEDLRVVFRNLKLMMYAGAGLTQLTRTRCSTVRRATGQRILTTGWAPPKPRPFRSIADRRTAGQCGHSAQGTVKLVPVEGKYELLKGLTSRQLLAQRKLTAEAFDEEGFYRIGDAVKFAVEGAPQGLLFRRPHGGKLQARPVHGSMGDLRAVVNQFGGLIRDAVITGENRPSSARYSSRPSPR